MAESQTPCSSGGQSSESSESDRTPRLPTQGYATIIEKVADMTHEDKVELMEADCYNELGFGFPEKKKWTILTLIFFVQVSMNFNTSLYGNAIHGITKEFGVSAQGARCGAMIFLIAYAFGCELWAPWYVRQTHRRGDHDVLLSPRI